MRIFLAAVAAFAITLSPAAPAPAQKAPAASQSERNLQDFDFVTSTIRENYAGWHTKVTPAKAAELDALTARLRGQAAAASEQQLLSLMREWLAFFNDRHIGVAPIAADASQASQASYPAVTETAAELTARLQSLGNRLDPIEGIWNIQGDLYRMAVLRTGTLPDRFQAIVLTTKSPTWKPGQIKAEFTRRPDGKFDSLFRPGDHSDHSQLSELIADGQAITVPAWDTWQREWPPVADRDRLRRMLPPRDLSMEVLSPDTLLLRIPDFNDTRAKPLKELMETHSAQLARMPNLIIDVRNNGGGSDYVYDPLIPYLYTRPIVTVGMELRATAENIAAREAIAERLRTEAPDQARELERQNRLMRANLGKYIVPDPRPFEITRRDQVLPFPKRVAVLIDGAGSSGEQFVLLARQSRKVTLFGQRNTAGVLDFANVVAMPSPSGRYRVNWAISRSLRLPEDPVDPDGIPPDIRIPDSVSDPVSFAQEWLKRQAD